MQSCCLNPSFTLGRIITVFEQYQKIFSDLPYPQSTHASRLYKCIKFPNQQQYCTQVLAVYIGRTVYCLSQAGSDKVTTIVVPT